MAAAQARRSRPAGSALLPLSITIDLYREDPINRSEIEQVVRQIVLARLGGANQQAAPLLRVDASARHLHLCPEDLETLFGPGANSRCTARSIRKATTRRSRP